MWSFSVVLWEMAAERLPYSDQDRPIGAVVLGVVQGVLRLELDECGEGTPPEMAACIAACLEFESEAPDL